MSRIEIVERFVELAYPSLQLQDLGNGWPSTAEFQTEHGIFPVSIFASRIGRSHRGRDAQERRFQNPAGGISIEVEPETLPLLIGAWESDPVLQNRTTVYTLVDARRRTGRKTRWSVFISTSKLVEAERTGWSTQTSDSGERILCFRPELTPLAIESYRTSVELDDLRVQHALRETIPFVADGPHPVPANDAKRLRRTVNTLVRDTRFRGSVLDAYSWRCAMCSLGLSLVEGAHIYPASAPASSDHESNGVCLCANHHLAFDRHQIAIIPYSLNLEFHPDVLDMAAGDYVTRRFVEQTHGSIARPKKGDLPSNEMLYRRYEYFSDHYDWLNLP